MAFFSGWLGYPFQSFFFLRSSFAEANMVSPSLANAPDSRFDHVAESRQSAVSWAAVFAGAAIAAVVSLLLLTLGAGLGFASVSPWSNTGATATTFAVGTAIFLIVVQWLSAAFGGYIAGRLRTKWSGVHSNEVFFRDTAHGLLAWAIATLLSATILTSAISSLAGSGAQAVAGLASSAAQGASQATAQSSNSLDPSAYLVDGLFRTDSTSPNASASDAKAEAARILATSLQNGSMDPADKTYLARVVSARTGIAQPDAERRIDDLTAKAKAAADKARSAAEDVRKASTKLSFYLFFSMLIGAFIACVGGALGGRERDLA